MSLASVERDGLNFAAHRPLAGYFHNEAKTRELFHGDWLDTSDRGYIAAGDVFVTGGIKDIIIRAGRHLYPQEIVEAVAACPASQGRGGGVWGARPRVRHGAGCGAG